MFLAAISIDPMSAFIRALIAEPAASIEDEVMRFPVASLSVDAARALSAVRALKTALFTLIELLMARLTRA